MELDAELIFYIHFDLLENHHDIPISQSLISEESLIVIVNEINNKIFNSQLELKILVHPVEQGSHLKKFSIGIIGLGGFVLGNLFPDLTNGIVMGLGDGRNISEYVKDGTIGVKNFVKTSIESFYKKDTTDLVHIGLSYDTFYKAYDAKNKFYYAAMSNPNNVGIGFDNSPFFPVARENFALKIVPDLKNKLSSIDPIDKFHKLIVISSINTQEDRKLSRHVKDEKVLKRFELYMGDNSFYDFFLANPFYLKSLLVKVRYYINRDEEGKIQIEKKEIINVFQYNDQVFSELPGDYIVETAPWKLDGDCTDSSPILPHQEGLFDGF